MLRLLLGQEFERNAVVVRHVASGRRELPEVEAAIEQAWRDTLARPGVRLFDGPIYRFESASVESGRLTVSLSPSSYRILVGTNFCNPQFVERFGPEVMANSMGVSTGLLTVDGFWMMGRRNTSVAYYPGRVHPFAGSIETAESVDLFANAERELREELHLQPQQIERTRLLGLVEDTLLRHPEAIFLARTPLTHDAVARGLDADEHDGVWSVKNERDDLSRALAIEALTPVARAVLLLGGRHTLGETWFESHRSIFVE